MKTKKTAQDQKARYPRDRWETLRISVPGRVGADGTESPASHFVCETRLKDNGRRQVVSVRRVG